MRKNIFRLALVAVTVSLISSCAKEDDNDGPVNQTLDRDKFITHGTPWHVRSQHSPSGQIHYWDMTIVAGSSSSEILLDNFDQMGSTNHVTASVSGNGFTISPQYGPPDSTLYQGSGTFNTNNSTLTFTYSADDGVQVDQVSATANR
jgi:hypothetical protein